MEQIENYLQIKTQPQTPNQSQFQLLKQQYFKHVQQLIQNNNLQSKSNVTHSQINIQQFIQILQLLKIIYQDQFTLSKAAELRTPIRKLILFTDNYFSIVPSLFSVYISKQLKNGTSLQTIDNVLKQKIQYFGDKYVRKAEGIILQQINVKFPQTFKPSQKINQFQKNKPIINFDTLIQQIQFVSKNAQQHLSQFHKLVVKTCTNSCQIKTGVKIQSSATPVIKFLKYIRVFQKMFEKNIKTMKKDIQKDFADRISNDKSFNNQINTMISIFLEKIQLQIFKSNKQNRSVECLISDFLRGNAYFQKFEDFQNAINSIFVQCETKKYRIIEKSQRKTRGTSEIVLRLVIDNVIAQIQLIKLAESSQLDLISRQFIHTLYQIRRSPLSCIMGTYLLFTKQQYLELNEKLSQIKNQIQSKNIQKHIEQKINYFLMSFQQNS